MADYQRVIEFLRDVRQGAGSGGLQTVSEEQRKEILARPQFQARFSAQELQIITELSAVMAP